ncbi:MAG: ABC transporter permease [Clostridia bacterium]|nr:ABC transporter permease [Clostridia bacterium]MBQ2948238.1 ABC transporter permease [Clostridia bacterium]MBQ4609666.1 ABC transporter permease [Clostridia bacterium]MBQ7052706.1 ABC transporter permease [Clostridia bacterium]
MESNKEKKSLTARLASSEAFLSVAASLICILIGLALGVVVLAIINPAHAFKDGLLVILQSGLKSPRNMGTVLANAAPLIMTGLSVGFAFKTGLFNIGAAGQYTVGAFGALYCALVLHLPWYLCLLVAMIFGALWGAIPGIFKAYLNINEVITAIMFNWIGLYMVNDIMYGKGKSPMYDLATTKTYSLRKAAPESMIPSCGMSDMFGKLQSVTIAIFIAVFLALVVYIVLNKTTFGYELRACGFNKNAAQYAGINDKRNIILSMTIAGALAGVGAGLYYLSTVAEWNPQVSTALPAIGFNGISAALLACSNPIGTIFSSLFISYITVGGTKLSTQYYTKEIADVITALIIYLCAFSLLFKNKIRAVLAGKTRNINVGKGGDA